MNRVITIILTGNTAGLQSSLIGAQTAVRALGIAVAAMGLVMAAALGKSVGSAAEFQKQMLNVSTISQSTRDHFSTMSNQVLEMSRQFPQAATTLAKGLYNITSSGFDGAEAMSVLAASARAASAGLTTTDVAAKGVAAVLNAYGMSGFEAAKVSDILFQTVNKGVITFEELSNQLGDFVAMAAAFGRNAKGDFVVPFEDAAAAMATMTLSGLSAAEASTSLNRVLTSLLKPSAALSAVLKQQGYETSFAAVEALGLQGTMELLRKATDGNVQSIVQLFPEIRAARGALALMTNEGKNYKEVAHAITDETERLNATQKAYNEQSKGLIFQQQLAKNAWTALSIELGQTFLPVLTAVTDLVGGLFTSFSAMPGPVKSVTAVLLALGAAAAIVGGAILILGPNLIRLTTAFPGLASAVATATPYLIGVGGALALVTVALAVFGAESRKAKEAADSYKAAIQQEAEGTKGAVAAKTAQLLVERNLVKQAKDLHISLTDVAKAAEGDKAAMDRVRESHSMANREFRFFYESLQKVADAHGKGAKAAAEEQKALDALDPAAAKVRSQLASLGAEVLSNAEKWDELAGKANLNTFALVQMSDKSLDVANNIVNSLKATTQAFESQTDIVGGFASLAAGYDAAMDRLVSAQDSLATASENAGERQKAAAERVQDAQQNYADTAERIAEQVAEAQDRAAQRQVDAAERVAEAEARANDQRKSAADRLKDAQQRLRDLQERQSAANDPKRAAEVARQQEMRKALQDVTDARQEQVDVEKQAAKDLEKARAEKAKADKDAAEAAQMTTAQQRQLADAQKAITKAQEQGAKEVAEAQKAVAAALKDVAKAQEDLSKISLEGFFGDQTKLAQQFVDDVQEAARRGLDPALIQRLLEAGPEKAEPFLRRLLDDHSGHLIEMANTTQATLNSLSESTLETLRVQQTAINAKSTEIASEYETAMKILQAKAKLGGKATGEELAKALGLSVDDVRKVAHDYTIVLSDELNNILRGIGAKEIANDDRSNYSPTVGRAPGGLPFAGGGILPRDSGYQSPGTLVQWAEPETMGEYHAFIPRSGAKRDNAERVLGIAAEDFGLALVPKSVASSMAGAMKSREFAGGGILSAGDIPKPPDFGPYGDKLGYTAAEASKWIYQKVVKWVTDNVAKGGTLTGNGYGFQALIDYLQLQNVPFEVTSTLRPGSITSSGNLSLHATGQAADFVSSNMRQIFDTFLQVAGSLQELFFDPAGFSVKNGQLVDWTVGGHDDHVHAASWLNASHGPGLPTSRTSGFSMGADAISIGRSMAADRGWSGSEWDALYALWTRESGWDPNAVNPTSGAYGIPQALPDAHGHPYDLGDVPAQVRWGLDYIAGRYGDPIAANEFQEANNWYAKGGFHGMKSYDRGGYLQPGVTLAYNGTGRPEAVGAMAIDYDKLGKVIAREMASAIDQTPRSVLVVDRPFVQKVDKGLRTVALERR